MVRKGCNLVRRSSLTLAGTPHSDQTCAQAYQSLQYPVISTEATACFPNEGSPRSHAPDGCGWDSAATEPLLCAHQAGGGEVTAWSKTYVMFPNKSEEVSALSCSSQEISCCLSVFPINFFPFIKTQAAAGEREKRLFYF